MFLHESVTRVLAGGPIGDPTPISPIASGGVATILGYAMWGAIIACGVVALVAGGILAVGQLSNNPGHSDKGKRALLYALGGVAIAAIAIPTVNTVFGPVHATS
ncbi:MAG: hypothetical protein ACRDN0_13715 [Trebonia sp.]